MPIKLGNTSTDGRDAGSTNHTWSHNNDGTLLVVTFGIKHEPGSRYATGVTYDGDALTRAVRSQMRQGGVTDVYHGTEVWYLVNPSTGANNIVASYSSSQDEWAGGAASFNGVLLTDALEDTGAEVDNNSTQSLTFSLTATKKNSLFVDMHQVDNTATTNPTDPTRTGVIYDTQPAREWRMTYITDVDAGVDAYVSGASGSNYYMSYCGALFNPKPSKPKVVAMI